MIRTISHHKPIQTTESADGNHSSTFATDCVLYESRNYDTVDNPDLKKLIGEPHESEESIFQKMKYECNRLYSFQSKWPINEISSQSLANAGFFYLQHEDRVQCPFCYVIIYNWTSNDKPLREHMKKSPKCSFLMGSDVGNIPLISRQKQTVLKPILEKQYYSSTNVNYKPKCPRMADTKRRLLTYSGWQSTSPSPQQLAECGLYYSGVADVVICFFCGGSLGNWELHDDPWIEHTKFFPECSFLSLNKGRNTTSSKKIIGSCGMEAMKSKSKSPYQPSSSDVTSEVVKEALNIFPKNLVLEAVKRRNGSIFSLQELCDDILLLNQRKKTEYNTPASSQTSSDTKVQNQNNVPANSDVLLCKICMDNERGALFQPCGHLVACWNCARMVSDCPVCRRPIINAVRAYYS